MTSKLRGSKLPGAPGTRDASHPWRSRSWWVALVQWYRRRSGRAAKTVSWRISEKIMPNQVSYVDNMSTVFFSLRKDLSQESRYMLYIPLISTFFFLCINWPGGSEPSFLSRQRNNSKDLQWTFRLFSSLCWRFCSPLCGFGHLFFWVFIQKLLGN